MDKTKHSIIKRIAFIGNYAPRQCGIATFTTDLCEAVAQEYKGTACIALPVNDTEEGYEYPSRVRFELTEKDIESYRRAADFLNINNVDMVSLQHEYGIYGGRAGGYILALLHELRMPVVTTLHTILRDPNPDQRRVLTEIISLWFKEADQVKLLSLGAIVLALGAVRVVAVRCSPAQGEGGGKCGGSCREGI
jgi:glycosyltransferase involved in cell wall biosynthesis